MQNIHNTAINIFNLILYNIKPTKRTVQRNIAHKRQSNGLGLFVKVMYTVKKG
jgi:hypothetical protein